MATRQMKDSPASIELSKYDKIEEVFISYREHGIQGIAFGITDAIGRKKISSFGVKYYNHAMFLKPNECITQLSGKIRKTEQHTAISSLKIHTNLRPSRIFEDEDEDSKEEENEKSFSKPILTRDGYIAKISATGNQDEKKGTRNEPFILSSIVMDVEELHYEEKEFPFPDIPAVHMSSHELWSMKVDRCEYIKEIIIISSGDIVHGLGFVVIDAEGQITPTQWFGSVNDGGGEDRDIYRITLKHNEYIVQVSVTYSSDRITSLRIHTNLKPSGYKQCGNRGVNDKDSSVVIPTPTSDSIAQIYGNYDDHGLKSIGLHLREPQYKGRKISIPDMEKKNPEVHQDQNEIKEEK